MDLLGFSSKGQPRTLQEASTGPIPHAREALRTYPHTLYTDVMSVIYHHSFPRGPSLPLPLPSAQFQLKNHTPIWAALVPHCSVFILKAESLDSHFLAELCNFDLKVIVPWFLFPQTTALRWKNLTLAPSDINKWAHPCSWGASVLARETKPTLASSWKTEQGSK